MILQEEITQRDLLFIYDKFFEDEINIRDCVITVLPKFLQKVKPENRDDYFYKIKAQTDIYGKNWRQKLSAAHLLFSFPNVFDNDFTYQIILPSCLTLCVDNVAELRNYSCKQVSKYFIQFLTGFDSYNPKTMKIVDCFAMSFNFKFREMFILMCYKLIKNENLFKSHFLKYLKLLVNDKVIGVRMHLAELILKQFLKSI